MSSLLRMLSRTVITLTILNKFFKIMSFLDTIIHHDIYNHTFIGISLRQIFERRQTLALLKPLQNICGGLELFFSHS